MKISRQKRSCNLHLPPLFAWADARERDHSILPLPARVLARRFGLTPQRAALIAQLAGIGDSR